MHERERRWLVAATSLLFALARTVRPDLNIDLLTLALVALAGAALLLPSLSSMLPYVKRVRFGGAEVELRDDIKALGVEVETANRTVADSPAARPEAQRDVEEVLEEAAKDPRAALLLVSARLERTVKDRLREAGVESRFGLAPSVEVGVPAIHPFWWVRLGRIAQGGWNAKTCA